MAEFYTTLMKALHGMGIDVTINTKPQEMAVTTPFEEDHEHASYDPEYARRFFQVLVSTQNVMQEFRGRFIGKSSPVHFFWGSFDLACTRFCGRPAPPRKGVITGPAYSHEEISAGFWPGAGFDGPAFYAYAAPAPAGLELETGAAGGGRVEQKVGEFILMYDDVRQAESPRDALLEFLQSTYEAAARLAKWDRAALEAQTVRHKEEQDEKGLFASRPDSGQHHGPARLRGVPEEGRFVGTLAPVHGMRPRGLLRLLEKQARHQTLSPDQPSPGAVA